MSTMDTMVKTRAKMILRSPFFAQIALHLRLKEAPGCGTAFTDSVVLGFDPAFIKTLDAQELTYLIYHEVMHIVLMHPFRRGPRDPYRWNVACDYVVNGQLQTMYDCRMPAGGLYDQRYTGMTAEQIYQILPESEYKNPSPSVIMIGDVHDYVPGQDSEDGEGGEDGKDGKGRKGKNKPKNGNNDGEDKGYSRSTSSQEQMWKIKVSQAAMLGRQQGYMPSGMERIITDMLEPKQPWRELLNRFITVSSRNDYSWKLPNPRYLYAGLYLPKLDSPALGTIVTMVDTSGSISTRELDQYASEMRSILNLYPATKIEVIYADAGIAHTETLDAENLELHPKGGGGTDYRPAFEHVEKEGMEPVCGIYFTDGDCDSFPNTMPSYPVLWLVNGNTRFNPPFGEVILYEG